MKLAGPFSNLMTFETIVGTFLIIQIVAVDSKVEKFKCNFKSLHLRNGTIEDFPHDQTIYLLPTVFGRHSVYTYTEMKHFLNNII